MWSSAIRHLQQLDSSLQLMPIIETRQRDENIFLDIDRAMKPGRSYFCDERQIASEGAFDPS
jgi:hypothetical protein